MQKIWIRYPLGRQNYATLNLYTSQISANIPPKKTLLFFQKKKIDNKIAKISKLKKSVKKCQGILDIF